MHFLKYREFIIGFFFEDLEVLIKEMPSSDDRQQEEENNVKDTIEMHYGT